ncbi:hypothetical protein [Nocardioides rubriscoriae]|uniref:hypothetical protein n=1 Tax=Nocardioides rubriscoriae TaxID=642762 RepID=UPI0011E0546F|nr:hypothetical protein [Nocardioides rubriscoriae]
MRLQLILSSATTADQVISSLTALGHAAAPHPDVPGGVVVEGLDPFDASTVHRIAAMIDHPAARTAVPA